MKSSWFYAAALALALPAITHAQTWTELGDAGDLLSTAQAVTTPSPSIIYGGINPTFPDADVFALRLTAGVAFSATTVSFGGLAGISDTQLFLFESEDSGHGIRYNDDIDVIDFYSAINFTPASTGTYYLGISAVDFNPRDAQGSFIYVRDPFDPTATPGASQFGPLASWAAAGGFTDFGNYQINLVGAAPVPEPGTVVLMALGLAGLFAGRRWMKA